MKYAYNVFVMASALLFAVSCKKDVPPHGGTTRHCILTLEEDNSKKLFEDTFCDVEFIPLENKRECMIGNCMKVVVEGNRIYLWDMNGTDALLSFNMDGSFHGKIGEKGHSKHEYTYVKNFSVNRSGDTIALLDYNVLKYYDADGKFVGSEETDYSWDNMLYSTKGLVLGSHYRGIGRETLLQIRDLYSGDVKDVLPVDSTRISYPPYSMNTIQQVGDTVCFFDFLSSTFYLYDVHNPDDAESIQLLTDNILDVKRAKRGMSSDEFDNDEVEKFVYTGSEIMGLMLIGGQSVSFKIDVKKKKAYRFNFRNGFCEFDCYHDGYFYFVMPSSWLLDECKYSRTKGEVYKKALEIVNNGLSEKDNDVVMRCRLKKWNK